VGPARDEPVAPLPVGWLVAAGSGSFHSRLCAGARAGGRGLAPATWNKTPGSGVDGALVG